MHISEFLSSNLLNIYDLFHLGLQIPIKAPESARGELEITYLDEELR